MWERFFGKKSTISKITYSVPSEYARAIGQTAVDLDKDPNDIMRSIFKFGLLVDKVGKTENGGIFISKGEIETPVTLDTATALPIHGEPRNSILPDLTDITVIDPQADVAEVFPYLQVLSHNEIQKADNKLQQQARTLSDSLAEDVVEQFDNVLSPEQRIKLERILEGVVVVRNLKRFIKNPYDLTDLTVRLPKWTQGLVQVSIDVSGLVVRPYHAMFLDETIFNQQSLDPDNRNEIIRHEMFHTLSNNNLPMLLNEAATDIYAAADNPDSTAAKRMTGNFASTHKLWQEVTKIVGPEVAFSGYSESSLIEYTLYAHNQHVIKKSYLGHPLHKMMQDQLGVDKHGNSYWDVILALVDKKEGKKAFSLFEKLTK